MESVHNQLLTPLELRVMQILWRLERAFVKDILEHWQGEPLPAYNTISTVVRILQEKEFVGHRAYGRTHEYFAQVSKEAYQRQFLRNTLERVFEGSVVSLVSTLVGEERLKDAEMEELKKMLE